MDFDLTMANKTLDRVTRSATRSLLLFTCLLLTGCRNTPSTRASTPTRFNDPGNRIVTVERWDSGPGVAIAWAIYPDRVVVFERNDFADPEIVLAEKPVDASAVEEIRAGIRRLPGDLTGKAFSKRDVWDGILFRISFAPTGQLTRNRVEFENVYLPEMAKLFETMDRHLPAGYKIGYKEIEALRRFKDLETVVKDVEVP
jgi:hypothetical protein